MRSRSIYRLAAILALTAVYACWCRAPLIWDGAYQFNATLIAQRPYFYGTRFHTYLLWMPTVWASGVTSNVNILQAIYGLPFLLTPAVALLLSWWMVHKHRPQLILWAIFGIAAAALPGQIFVINDSIFQQHLFWPIFMGIFVPLSIPKKIVIGILAVFQMVHPIGMLLFFTAAACALAVGLIDKPNRRRMFIRAAVMAVLCIVVVVKVEIPAQIHRIGDHFPSMSASANPHGVIARIEALNDHYAQEEASWRSAVDRWFAGVMGWPIRGLWCMWTAAVLALLYGMPRRQFRPRVIVIMSVILALAGVVCMRLYRVHPGEAWYPISACAIIYLSALLLGDRADVAAVAATLIILAAGFHEAREYLHYPLDLTPIWIARAVCAVLVVCLLLLRRTADPSKLAGGLMLLCAAVGAGLWVYWAHDGHLWWKALDYRRWLTPLTAPFFVLAVIEACVIARSKPEVELASPEETKPLRLKLAMMVVATFAIVIGVQSTVWRFETGMLMAEVGKNSAPIVAAYELPMITGTPLDHWATADFVMAMQGRQPSKLLLFDRETEEKLYERPPRLPHWEMYPNATKDLPDPTPGPRGWYDLRPLLEQLTRTPGPSMRRVPQKPDAKMTPD
jgi:hypothetical protein